MLFFPPVFRSVFVGIFFTAPYYKTIIYVQLKCSTYLIQFDSLFTFTTKKTSNHKRGSYVITNYAVKEEIRAFPCNNTSFFIRVPSLVFVTKSIAFLHILARCSGFMWHFSYIYLPIFSDILFQLNLICVSKQLIAPFGVTIFWDWRGIIYYYYYPILSL